MTSEINTNYLLKTNTDGEKTLSTKADFKFPIFQHLTVDIIGKKNRRFSMGNGKNFECSNIWL